MNNAITIATLKEFLAAFNAHDLDAIMEFFSEDCELCMPRGKDPWGTRYNGKRAVREGLAARFVGIPDVHYAKTGEPIRVRGVDLLEFRDGKLIKKDSYWKIIEK